MPAHSHVSEEEILFIYERKGIINIRGKHYSLERGVTVFIPRDAEHYFRNSHPDRLLWVFVFSPPGYGESDSSKNPLNHRLKRKIKMKDHRLQKQANYKTLESAALRELLEQYGSIRGKNE